jgi:hypothetical protein
MKAFHLRKRALWLTVLVPATAHSADCESLAKTTFQKRSIAMEMAAITGEISEIELTDKREKLKKETKLGKEKCRRGLRVSKAPVARTQDSSF